MIYTKIKKIIKIKKKKKKKKKKTINLPSLLLLDFFFERKAFIRFIVLDFGFILNSVFD